MKRMKRMKRLLLAVCLLLLTLPAQAGWTVEETLPAQPGDRLEVDLKTGGSIRIEGWAKDEVSVTANISKGDASEVAFEINPTESGVAVNSRFKTRGSHSTSIEVVIMVPRRFDLDLNTMGGSLRIQDLEGRIVGETLGGELILDRLSGDLSLSTMGGEIKLSDSRVDGRVKTMGGNVFLSGVVGDVEATTMGGDVIYDRVEPGHPGQACQEVKIDTMGGDIEAQNAMCGAVLVTLGGSIRVEQAAEYVKAETLGGDIVIGAVDGWVRATTMGGNVSVRMIGDPSSGRRDVRLVSMDGDITLSVPDGLSMTIDISLAYTKKSQQKFNIDSDFPLELTQSDNWDYTSGSPRKYIRGAATIGDGEHKIKIETINGNVNLKKTR